MAPRANEAVTRRSGIDDKHRSRGAASLAAMAAPTESTAVPRMWEARWRASHKNTRRRKRSRPVSRVLCVLRRDSHSSRPGVAARLQQPTRERRGPRHGSLIWSCSGWGLPCRATLAPHAVRSYRTLSPLPDPLAGPSAVCSLLHWPSAHAAQALPGTLPCGARTFLPSARLPRRGRRRSGDCLVSFGAQYRGFACACHPSVNIPTCKVAAILRDAR